MKNSCFSFKLVVIVFIFFSCGNIEQNPTTKSNNGATFSIYKQSVLKQLDSITNVHKSKLIDYLSNIQSLADQSRNDVLLKSFFNQQVAFETIENKNKIPKEILLKSKKIESKLLAHFVDKYNQFYDMLIINKNGKIIFTIRKENDLNKNIYSKDLKNTLLSKKLSKSVHESFVDFQFYDISNEPSAFFIEPIIEENNLKGWLVFQFSTDKINSIFNHSQHLGKTGEVILVNKNHYMLTNSRFIPQTTILKQQLSKANIAKKFQLKEGRMTVTDYRGFNVFSSFEVFNYWDSEWLIITKINEAEVLTNYFISHQKKLFECIENALTQRTLKFSKAIEPINNIEVHIDEFKRAEKPETIHTKGLKTCTGILAYLPNKFAYLAHISPYDQIYNQNRTDILGLLLKRIEYLEITKVEKQLLKFVIVAPNVGIAKSVTKKLIANGIFLNQIKLTIKGEYRSAEIYYKSGDQDATIVLKSNKKSNSNKYFKTDIIPSMDKEICLEKNPV